MNIYNCPKCNEWPDDTCMLLFTGQKVADGEPVYAIGERQDGAVLCEKCGFEYWLSFEVKMSITYHDERFSPDTKLIELDQ